MNVRNIYEILPSPRIELTITEFMNDLGYYVRKHIKYNLFSNIHINIHKYIHMNYTYVYISVCAHMDA